MKHFDDFLQHQYFKHMMNYLEKNSLKDELFINKDGFFLKKSYFNCADELTQNSEKFKRYYPPDLSGNLLESLIDYFQYQCDIEKKLIKLHEVNFIFQHYLNATEDFFDTLKKLSKDHDLENQTDFYKSCLKIDFNKNIMPLYWMLKKNTYYEFLKERQENSDKGYNDYLCHILFKDISLISTLSMMEDLKNEGKGNNSIVNIMMLNIIEESKKINSFTNPENKSGQEEAQKMMKSFMQYELVYALDSYRNNEKTNIRKISDSLFNIENDLFRDDNKLILKLDRNLFSEASSRKLVLSDKMVIDEKYALVISEDGESYEGYKQKLNMKMIFTFNINKDLENKDLYMDALEEELEMLKSTVFSSLTSFYRINLNKLFETNLNQRVRERYLKKIISTSQENVEKEPIRRKI